MEHIRQQRVIFSPASLRILILLLIPVLFFSVGVSSVRATTENPRLTATLQQETTTLATLESLTDWVIRTEQELQEAQQRFNQTNYQMAEANRRISGLSTRSSDRKQYLNQRIRNLYKLSRGGVIRLLLEAGEEQNMATQLSAASLILRRDIKELDLYQQELHQLWQERQRLETQQSQQAGLLRQLEKKQVELQKARQEQQQMLEQLQQSRHKQLALAEELDQYQRALLKRISALHQRLWTAGGFAARRGRLSRPVKGPLVGIYGQVPDKEGKVMILRHGLTFKPTPLAEVRAVAPGTVRVAGAMQGYGKLVLLEHTDGYYTVYGLLSKIMVREGTDIKKHTVLGQAGIDSLTGQPALYFELRHQERPLDPAVWLRRTY